ncbi:MAG: TIGR03086 family metal-binding protein [Dermatophilaceae bacterium]
MVFTQNARKEPTRPPARLVDDWQVAIPAQLDDLARAWRAESAWQGRVSAGGIEMAAADNAVVAVEELTVHAWGLAAATGQRLEVDDDQLGLVELFFALFGQEPRPGEGPFGPHAPVPDDATRLDTVLARTGRDPRWRPDG